MVDHQKAQNVKPTKEAARQRRAVEPVGQEWSGQEPAELTTLQRAVANPGRARPADILNLQRAYGNRAISRLLGSAASRRPCPVIQPFVGPALSEVEGPRVQAKLTVGPAGDRYEREADRVADQVMTMPAPVSSQPSVQRQAEEEEEVQTKPLAATITPLVQRQAEEEEEKVQTKPLVQRQAGEEEEEIQTKPPVQRQADDGFEAGSELESRLAVHKGGGSPLPDETRAYMEPRFGTDFSGVRVHTGGEAVQMNRALSAQSFTHGQDIYFGTGKYDPGSSAGKRLLTHELTHVVQQGAARGPDADPSTGQALTIQRLGHANAACIQRTIGPDAKVGEEIAELFMVTKQGASGPEPEMEPHSEKREVIEKSVDEQRGKEPITWYKLKGDWKKINAYDYRFARLTGNPPLEVSIKEYEHYYKTVEKPYYKTVEKPSEKKRTPTPGKFKAPPSMPCKRKDNYVYESAEDNTFEGVVNYFFIEIAAGSKEIADYFYVKFLNEKGESRKDFDDKQKRALLGEMLPYAFKEYGKAIPIEEINKQLEEARLETKKMIVENKTGIGFHTTSGTPTEVPKTAEKGGWGGLKRTADVAAVKAKYALDKPWNPLAAVGKHYFRKYQNIDNELRTTVSIATDVRDTIRFPLVDDLKQRKITKGMADPDADPLVMKAHIYAVAIKKGFNTALWQKQAGASNVFSEVAVGGVEPKDFIGYAEITRKHPQIEVKTGQPTPQTVLVPKRAEFEYEMGLFKKIGPTIPEVVFNRAKKEIESLGKSGKYSGEKVETTEPIRKLAPSYLGQEPLLPGLIPVRK